MARALREGQGSRRISRYFSALIVAWALVSCAHAGEFSLPPIFGDHMVLQREQPVAIWGTAARGKEVELRFDQLRLETRADARGRWQITLPPMSAGGPFKLIVTSGAHTRTLSDVFLGEVWLAAGQSNMAFRFRLSDPTDQATALRSVHEYNVRSFGVARIVSAGKLLEEPDRPWSVANANVIADWSAVGVFFSQALGLEKSVAIGIIEASQGSSTIEAWMSDAALAEAQAAGYVHTQPYQDLRRHYRNPTVLHRSMVSKIVPYGIRGVLWYQGESNVGNAASYQVLLPALIRSWRTLWQRPELPFLLAQLPRHEPPQDMTGRSWARFRAAQANVHAAVPHTGMAVLIDTGNKDDLHPRDKKAVGERFARVARALVYGEDIVYSGPVLDRVEYAKDSAVIYFRHAEGGLVAEGDVANVEVRGRGGAWRQVVPQIDADRLLVRHPEGDEITGVRHAWANAPLVNLHNKAGLPAAPFGIER